MGDSIDTVIGQWRAHRPDLDPSPMAVVGRVQRLSALWDAALRGPFAAAGLAPGEFDLLAALRRADRPLSPTELATSMLVTGGAATKRVDRLESAGLVTRSVSAVDGRARRVTLTARGRKLVDRLIGEHLANEERLLASLDTQDRRLLAGLLSTLLHAAE